MKKRLFGTILLLFCLILTGCSAKKAKVVIDADDLGVEISKDLYGIFLEDISFACDGGLVGNLIANTGFEYHASPLFNWSAEGLTASVQNEGGMNENNPSYCRLTVTESGSFFNKGYVEYYKYLTQKMQDGLSGVPDMGFKAGTNYLLSFYVKNIDYDGSCRATLVTGSGTDSSYIDLPAEKNVWQKVTATISSSCTADGGLRLDFTGNGTLLVDDFRLSSETDHGYDDPKWKHVTLRADLYQALKNLNPSFVRFPGGCLAEGTSLADLYDWKETIGDTSERKHYVNIWNDDGSGLYYDNTNAMGYHEYFQLSEDLGAEPLPILNAGTICQFQMKKDGKDYFEWQRNHREGKISDEEWNDYLDLFALRPGTEEFDAYVQDILDLIEYANGDKDTTVWGAKRAENGHEERFSLKYIGIGNENWGDLYTRNFDAIYKVLKEKAPGIKIISSAGPFFDGEEKEEAYEKIDELYSDTLVDEHYYLNKEKMFRNGDYYDSYPRTRQVFVGEYATTCLFFGKYLTKNNLWSAIEEAGYMCGFERNGDVVKMASYAPTFAKINAQRWPVNLVWFDSQNIVLTPNYFTQMLFSNNVGTRMVNTSLDIKGVRTSATVDEKEQVVYYKVINENNRPIDLELDVKGFGNVNAASVQYIADSSKAACNEIGSTTVVPRQEDLSCSGSSVKVTVSGQSINVIRIAYGDNDGAKLYSLPDLPDEMQKTQQKYAKPYLTLGGLIAVCVTGGVLLLAGAVIVFIVLVKKGKIRLPFKKKGV